MSGKGRRGEEERGRKGRGEGVKGGGCREGYWKDRSEPSCFFSEAASGDNVGT